MKILYLYAELMGYQIPILKEYVNNYNAEVHVIHWDLKKLTPYKPPEYDNVYYYNRSSFSVKQLKDFVFKSKPDIVYISGWMDKGYLVAVRPLRKLGIPVVTAFDGIWWKTFRQRMASVLLPPFRKLFFSHAWVAGPYQYEYAKRFGFRNTEIIYNCFSADTEIFNRAYKESTSKKKENYPHRFLYAGRLESKKGIDILVQAWNEIGDKKKDWELCIIGNGRLYDQIASHSEIIQSFSFTPGTSYSKNHKPVSDSIFISYLSVVVPGYKIGCIYSIMNCLYSYISHKRIKNNFFQPI